MWSDVEVHSIILFLYKKRLKQVKFIENCISLWRVYDEFCVVNIKNGNVNFCEESRSWMLNQQNRLTTLCASSSSIPWWTTGAQSEGLPPIPMSGSCRWFSPSVFALLIVHLGRSIIGKFTRTWEFHFFADHIRALTESFDSKLADAGNPLVRQLGRYLWWPRADLCHLRRKPRMMMASRPVKVTHKMATKSIKRIVPNAA